MHISLPRYMHREMQALMNERGIGPSELMRSIYDQAKAARLPAVTL